VLEPHPTLEEKQMRRIIPAFQFLVLALEDDAPTLLRRALRWI
jgi:hypothetical protein